MISEEEFGKGGAKFNQIALLDMLKKRDVCFKGKRKLKEVTEEGAIFEMEAGEKETIKCEQVILSLGVRPEETLIRQFECCAPEVINIGDCSVNAGNLYHAVHSAHEAASTI